MIVIIPKKTSISTRITSDTDSSSGMGKNIFSMTKGKGTGNMVPLRKPTGSSVL